MIYTIFHYKCSNFSICVAVVCIGIGIGSCSSNSSESYNCSYPLSHSTKRSASADSHHHHTEPNESMRTAPVGQSGFANLRPPVPVGRACSCCLAQHALSPISIDISQQQPEPVGQIIEPNRTRQHHNQHHEQFAMSSPSSFPKRSFFHKIIGSITLVLILVSMAILATKRCHQAVATETETRELNTQAESGHGGGQVKAFVSSYYYKLHILHTFSLTSAFLIVVFSFLDLVPTRDDDIKYAFHFVSVFAIFCISLSTMYASFIAFERPCTAPEGSSCCTIVTSPGLLSRSDKKAITSVNSQDIAMMAVMVLDLFAGILQFMVAIVYFRDVRKEAEECGYLHRVHNEGYIIR